MANDSISAFSGTYGVAAFNGFNGIVGPRATVDGLTGLPDNNIAVATVANTANSFATLPAFNLNKGAGTNVLTITAWIYPQGAQAINTGVIFSRAGTTVSGINYNPSNAHLGYTWNNDGGTYGWDSGITPAPNVWSLIALVITPTNASIYVFNTNSGLLSSTFVHNHPVQKFDGITLVGQDSFGASRTFNGSIDEVAFYGQALSSGQLAALFSAGSGIAAFPPTIGVNPDSWSPATVYPGQTASITVGAAGTAPLSYQWLAGVTNSGVYANLTDGGNISGVTSSTLTITNVQSTNFLDYLVRISNPYGAVTSTVPARLTVLPTGPAINFTLNYGGNPVVLGIGGDWNSLNAWNPGGLPASTSATYGNPGSSYELVVGSLLRNPASTTYNVFPGDTLIVDGNGGFEDGTINGIGEIRFKNSVSTVTTNYFKNLVLNGGMLNIGDSTDVILQGRVTVATNSTFGTLGGTGSNQTYQVDSYLTGSGRILLYLSNSTPAASLNITGNTNTFTGQWDIEQGPLVGSGVNSLGTNSIAIGANGHILETTYPINNPDSRLVLNGQVFLTQNDTFRLLILNGTPLVPGTYSATTLSATYPANFPATFPALHGTTATIASGQITVLASSIPVAIANQPASIRALTNTTPTFSVGAVGYPINYQWYQISGGVTNAIADATNATYTTALVQNSDSGTGYLVVISNQNNSVSSATAYLTVGQLVLGIGYLKNDQYSGLTDGTTALTAQLYPASAWLNANTPSKTEYLSVFDGNQDLPVNTGQQIYGWFTPPVSGDYVFFITSDDNGALWLSTDSTAANAYQIAQVQGWMVHRDWTCLDTASAEHANYFSTGEWRSDQL